MGSLCLATKNNLSIEPLQVYNENYCIIGEDEEKKRLKKLEREKLEQEKNLLFQQKQEIENELKKIKHEYVESNQENDELAKHILNLEDRLKTYGELYSSKYTEVMNAEKKKFLIDKEHKVRKVQQEVNLEKYNEDVIKLFKAMEGFGTDEGPIIAITCKYNKQDRLNIITAYYEKYSKDLIFDLKDELGGNLKDLIVGLFQKTVDFEVQSLESSLGFSVNEDTVIEILIRSKNLKKLQTKYLELYSTDLVELIKKKFKKDLQKMLVALLKEERSINDVDSNQLSLDLELVQSTLSSKNSDASDQFFSLFGKRSFNDINQIAKNYEKTYGKSLKLVIDPKFNCPKIKLFFDYIIDFSINKIEFYCNRLKFSNDGIIIRTFIYEEENIQQINSVYKTKFGKSLYDVIPKNYSGDFKLLLETYLRNCK